MAIGEHNQSFFVVQVGFDLVDLQIPLKFVPQSVASRIEWVHGNLCVPSHLQPSMSLTF